jgi:putative transposase
VTERPHVIQQAYRFALAPKSEQEVLLLRFTGATRFFFNWGLALVKQRLNERAIGSDTSLPWSYKALCSEFAKVKDEVAPWRREVVVGSQQAGLEQLGRALQNFSARRREGRPATFPRFREKGRDRETIVFQRPRLCDSRHIEFDRRLGPVRTKERMSKLLRLLAQDPRARVLRSTVSCDRGSWFVSFTVERSPKRRAARLSTAAIGVDVGLASLATVSTGVRFANTRPLDTSLRRLRRHQRQLERQRRAGNPGNYRADGRAKPEARDWQMSVRMKATQRRVRRLHKRVANLRREQTHQLTTMLAREYGVIGVETLAVRNLMANRRLARQISDVGWGSLLRQLEYKSTWAGSTLVTADRFYPSSKTCSVCTTVRPKLALSERLFTCEACGHQADRDLNAAMNLAVMAQRHAQAEGLDQCYVAAAEAETVNARREQVRPEALSGLSSVKREASSDASQGREALAVASR